MANRPLAYMLSERKANLGKMAGKTVIQARPTGRKRVDHRSFCDEV
ncbi:MAG: histidinol phosphate phosphatase, partial [Prevotella intermedia]